MNHTDPYAKLGGGALDQELFKQKPTPPPHARDTSVKKTHRSQPHVVSSARPGSTSNARKTLSTDVMTSVLHDVNLRAWKEMIENTETHNSSLRLTTEESNDIEDVIQELKRQLKVKTSLNEVARLGLLYLVHDFQKHRERSLVYRVKKS